MSSSSFSSLTFCVYSRVFACVFAGRLKTVKCRRRSRRTPYFAPDEGAQAMSLGGGAPAAVGDQGDPLEGGQTGERNASAPASATATAEAPMDTTKEGVEGHGHGAGPSVEPGMGGVSSGEVTVDSTVNAPAPPAEGAGVGETVLAMEGSLDRTFTCSSSSSTASPSSSSVHASPPLTSTSMPEATNGAGSGVGAAGNNDVKWMSREGHWRATIRCQGDSHVIGTYLDEAVARQHHELIRVALTKVTNYFYCANI